MSALRRTDPVHSRVARARLVSSPSSRQKRQHARQRPRSLAPASRTTRAASNQERTGQAPRGARALHPLRQERLRQPAARGVHDALHAAERRHPFDRSGGDQRAPASRRPTSRSVDGERLTSTLDGHSFILNPGPHDFSFSKDGHIFASAEPDDCSGAAEPLDCGIAATSGASDEARAPAKVEPRRRRSAVPPPSRPNRRRAAGEGGVPAPRSSIWLRRAPARRGRASRGSRSDRARGADAHAPHPGAQLRDRRRRCRCAGRRCVAHLLGAQGQQPARRPARRAAQQSSADHIHNLYLAADISIGVGHRGARGLVLGVRPFAIDARGGRGGSRGPLHADAGRWRRRPRARSARCRDISDHHEGSHHEASSPYHEDSSHESPIMADSALPPAGGVLLPERPRTRGRLRRQSTPATSMFSAPAIRPTCFTPLPFAECALPDGGRPPVLETPVIWYQPGGAVNNVGTPRPPRAPPILASRSTMRRRRSAGARAAPCHNREAQAAMTSHLRLCARRHEARNEQEPRGDAEHGGSLVTPPARARTSTSAWSTVSYPDGGGMPPGPEPCANPTSSSTRAPPTP